MKRLLTFLVVFSLLLTCFAGCTQDTAENPTDPTSGTEVDPEPVPAPKEDWLPEISGTKIRMYYDDRLAVSKLTDDAGAAVTLSNQEATSYKPGTGAFDDAVLYYDAASATLIAVGTGTATLQVGSATYEVSVEAAPISLFMITGHSIGEGQTGNAEQSVLCPAGTAYNTHSTRFSPSVLDTVGIGYSSDNKPSGINAFTTTGINGEDSGLAYRWYELTGEKVWVVNTAVGGSCLPDWIPGAANYEAAVRVFQSAQTVLANEICAGHFRLKNMAIIYHSAANFSYKGVKYTQEDLQDWYDAMWSGYQYDLAMDMDLDGKEETVTDLGFVPIWTTSNVTKYADDKPANALMGSDKSYKGMFMASMLVKDLVNGKAFPQISYTTISAPVTAPAYASAMFTDGTHLQQVVYNALGMDVAQNLYTHLREVEENITVTFHTADIPKNQSKVRLTVGRSISLVPVVSPITVDDLTYTVSDNLSLSYPCVVTAKAAGTGTLTVSQRGKVIATLTIEVS